MREFFDDISTAYYFSLKRLGLSDMTKQQMIKYLSNKGYSESTIMSVIEKLLDSGYLNDIEFVAKSMTKTIERQPISKRMLHAKLRQKGIDNEVLTDTLITFDENIELEMAVKLLEKKIIKLKVDSQSSLENKLIQFLLYKGFQWETIQKALKQIALNRILI